MATVFQTATQTCPECGAEVASTLAVCPNCGANLPAVARPGHIVIEQRTDPAYAGPAYATRRGALVVERHSVNWGGIVVAILLIVIAVAMFRYGMFPQVAASLKQDWQALAPSFSPPEPQGVAQHPGDAPAAPALAPARMTMLSFNSHLDQHDNSGYR